MSLAKAASARFMTVLRFKSSLISERIVSVKVSPVWSGKKVTEGSSSPGCVLPGNEVFSFSPSFIESRAFRLNCGFEFD